MSPYVGMARKQNGGYNGSTSVQTPIFHLVVNYTRMKTLRSAVWRCPKLYITLRVFKNVAIVWSVIYGVLLVSKFARSYVWSVINVKKGSSGRGAFSLENGRQRTLFI